MISPKTVSVLMANYNNGKYIEEAIKSVINQDHTAWELMIVDDFSSDNSAAILNEYAANDERIKIFFNEENKGCGFTKAMAANLAGGEYMIFLDPDDTLAPNAISALLSVHLNNPDCSIAYATNFICDENLNILNVFTYPGQVAPGDTQLGIDSEKITAPALFKSEAYHKTDGISSKLGKAVDQDLYAKLEEYGNVIFTDKPLYYYRQHSGGISQSHFENNLKAQYWYMIVARDAYQRRKRNPSAFVRNLTLSELKGIKFYYYQRAVHSALEKKKYKQVISNLFICAGAVTVKNWKVFLTTVRFICIKTFLKRNRSLPIC